MILLKNVIRYMLIFIGTFLLFVLGYLGCAFLFSRITVDAAQQTSAEIGIYIVTNGVHSDLVFPVSTAEIDWSEWFPYEQTTGKDSNQSYLGIGWGDKGFYLNTPTWADLTFSTAFNAVFGLGATAIHATYYSSVPGDKNAVRLHLSKEQYRDLIRYIQKSLLLNDTGRPIPINTNANYGATDAFYEAKGRYSMFTTCNTWTNNALKVSGQKACLWTPFQSGIFYPYQKDTVN